MSTHTHTDTHNTCHTTCLFHLISSPPSHSVPICRWVWLEAGALPEAESAVGVGGFGYPVSEGRKRVGGEGRRERVGGGGRRKRVGGGGRERGQYD